MLPFKAEELKEKGRELRKELEKWLEEWVGPAGECEGFGNDCECPCCQAWYGLYKVFPRID